MHGEWTCSVQQVPIPDSFDEETGEIATYPGKPFSTLSLDLEHTLQLSSVVSTAPKVMYLAGLPL